MHIMPSGFPRHFMTCYMIDEWKKNVMIPHFYAKIVLYSSHKKDLYEALY